MKHAGLYLILSVSAFVVLINCDDDGAKNTTPASCDPTVGVRQIEFSGMTWDVKNSSEKQGPGPNYFSSSFCTVWTTGTGDEERLHLKIRKVSDNLWHCAEIISRQTVGYGEYTFVVESPHIETLNPNVVLGLFIWDDYSCMGMKNTELDIEFAKWANPADSNTLQYAVQPSYYDAGIFPERVHRPSTPMRLNGSASTHKFIWTPGKVEFVSYAGDALTGRKVGEWVFDTAVAKSVDPNGRRSWCPGEGAMSDYVTVPSPTPDVRIHVNLWLFMEKPPSDGKDVEVVLRKIVYKPL